MKFSIQTYYNWGDRVERRQSKLQGTVVRSGMDPMVQWDNGELNEGHRIKMLRPVALTKSEIQKKIDKIRSLLGL